MDNRPIGIMDSGVGGLTVARVLHEKYPKESIIFLGDSLRNPYGERTRDEIARFAGEIKDFLIKKERKNDHHCLQHHFFQRVSFLSGRAGAGGEDEP